MVSMENVNLPVEQNTIAAAANNDGADDDDDDDVFVDCGSGQTPVINS